LYTIKTWRIQVHVICGAGTGTTLLKTFHDEGYSVSAGVLNVAYSDFEICELLKVLLVSDPSFSAITDNAHEANLVMIKNVNMVMLANVLFGR
jgi:iron complex transport system ATP-binding protein